MAGLGMTSLGMTPFGVGTPATAAAPPTSTPTATRFLNKDTRDYEVAPDGELKRMPSVRHRVLMLLGAKKGSSTVLPELGLELPDRIDGRYAQLADQRIRAALNPLIRSKELRITAIRVTRSPVTGRVDHLIAYADLTTGNPDTVTI